MKIVLALLSYIAVASAVLPNLVDIASTNNGTTLIQYLQAAGLTDVLRGPGPFTLIAPIDAAFAKIPQDVIDGLKAAPSDLANILQYHVVKGSIFEWDLINGEVLTSINGHSVRVYKSRSGQIYFNQAKVVANEVQGSNGVVYFVDEVLAVPEGTIDDIILNPDYSINLFMKILDASGYTARYNRTSGQRYTLFVPSNDAIQTLGQGVLDSFLNNRGNAIRLVNYHTHPGTLHEKSLTRPGKLSTLYTGHSIDVEIKNNQTLLNGVAQLMETDLEAEDGVVHVISHVLIPSTLAGIVG